MNKEALRKFHMNLLNHCDEFLELNVDIRIIDDYALQLANELEQALTTDRTLEIEKLKSMLKLAIQMGYGVDHMCCVDAQENKIVEKIISESEGTK